jgi:hypothetical protein
MTDQPSGKLYSTVTQYWPRIAVGLVAALGVAEFVAGGMTSDSALEMYLLAWATTTGGLWFLFDRAERVATAEFGKRARGWLTGGEVGGWLQSLPSGFASLFDTVFGRRHFSLRCVSASAGASLLSVLTLAALAVAVLGPSGSQAGDSLLQRIGAALLIFGLVNLIPDYLSLLETRWLVRVIGARQSLFAMVLLLVADLLITGAIALAAIFITAVGFPALATGPAGPSVMDIVTGWLPNLGSTLWQLLTFEPDVVFRGGNNVMAFSGRLSVFFYSTFFTSVWLWLYAASVLVSRVLLRMNSGVGLLLRVTDVENQPFRSMGFVSVLIVSALFALGLPLLFI